MVIKNFVSNQVLCAIGLKMISVLKNWIPAVLKWKIKWFVKTSLQSFVYFFVRGHAETDHAHLIIFVCKGNVCRSPFAECYFNSLSFQENLKIESCGLDVDQSVPSPKDASAAAREFGIDLTENRSKGLAACDLDKADLIVAMEYDHFKRLIQKLPHKKNQIVLLRDFTPWPEFLACNINDPYGCDLDEFMTCYETMKRALDRLAGRLAQNNRRQ